MVYRWTGVDGGADKTRTRPRSGPAPCLSPILAQVINPARANGSLAIPCMSCLSHRCSVSLLNKQLSLSLSVVAKGEGTV